MWAESNGNHSSGLCSYYSFTIILISQMRIPCMSLPWAFPLGNYTAIMDLSSQWTLQHSFPKVCTWSLKHAGAHWSSSVTQAASQSVSLPCQPIHSNAEPFRILPIDSLHPIDSLYPIDDRFVCWQADQWSQWMKGVLMQNVSHTELSQIIKNDVLYNMH